MAQMAKRGCTLQRRFKQYETAAYWKQKCPSCLIGWKYALTAGILRLKKRGK